MPTKETLEIFRKSYKQRQIAPGEWSPYSCILDFLSIFTNKCFITCLYYIDLPLGVDKCDLCLPAAS